MVSISLAQYVLIWRKFSATNDVVLYICQYFSELPQVGHLEVDCTNKDMCKCVHTGNINGNKNWKTLFPKFHWNYRETQYTLKNSKFADSPENGTAGISRETGYRGFLGKVICRLSGKRVPEFR